MVDLNDGIVCRRTMCKRCGIDTEHQLFVDVVFDQNIDEDPVIKTIAHSVQCLTCGNYVDLKSQRKNKKEIKLTNIENEVSVIDPSVPCPPTKPKWTETTWKLEKEMTTEEKEQWDKELGELSIFQADNQEDRAVLEEKLKDLRKLENASTGNRKIQYLILADLLNDFIDDMFGR